MLVLQALKPRLHAHKRFALNRFKPLYIVSTHGLINPFRQFRVNSLYVVCDIIVHYLELLQGHDAARQKRSLGKKVFHWNKLRYMKVKARSKSIHEHAQ